MPILALFSMIFDGFSCFFLNFSAFSDILRMLLVAFCSGLLAACSVYLVFPCVFRVFPKGF